MFYVFKDAKFTVDGSPFQTFITLSKFFVDGVINVWNALPSTMNFASLNVLGTALKSLIFLVLFFCNILFV